MTSSFEFDEQTTAGTALSGLTPTPSAFTRDRERRERMIAYRESSKLGKTMFATMPILLVGSMAVSMNLTGPIERVEAKQPNDGVEKAQAGKAPSLDANVVVQDAGTPVVETATESAVETAAAPATYTVVAGDTVSGIAGRFGLSTASVLALNGLGWKSTIFPGQSLKLTSGAAATPIVSAPSPVTAAPATAGRYTIVAGDTISGIAGRFNTSTQAILSANGLGWSSIIYPGQSLAIPGVTAVAPVGAVSPIVAAPVIRPIATGGTYTIVAGDTLTGIAAKVGTTLPALLAANGLSATSTIYAGRTLTIPGSTPASSGSGEITLLTSEQEGNARTIISVGRGLGVSDYGLVIGLSAAMQESSLRNINYGHLDSKGLFQQRPSSGWGTVEQLTDASYASRLFFGGPSNPNRGVTRGLLEITGWSSMTVTQAAQAVQISAYPDAYAKWETSARFWLADLS
jgi:LysM repeat protein